MNTSLKKLFTGFIVLHTLVNFAVAQEDEEVYVLSPFEIQDIGVTRYDAGASLAASRIAIPNIELPASITTISEQLIEDTVALTVRDTFNMVAGVNVGNQGTGSQTSNVFVVRGYTISGSQRGWLARYPFLFNRWLRLLPHRASRNCQRPQWYSLWKSLARRSGKSGKQETTGRAQNPNRRHAR